MHFLHSDLPSNFCSAFLRHHFWNESLKRGWNYFAKKAKTSEKSENISKAKIVLMFSQNSELDCVDSFCFRKVDLLFCEIISKLRNPRI